MVRFHVLVAKNGALLFSFLPGDLAVLCQSPLLHDPRLQVLIKWRLRLNFYGATLMPVFVMTAQKPTIPCSGVSSFILTEKSTVPWSLLKLTAIFNIVALWIVWSCVCLLSTRIYETFLKPSPLYNTIWYDTNSTVRYIWCNTIRYDTLRYTIIVSLYWNSSCICRLLPSSS